MTLLNKTLRVFTFLSCLFFVGESFGQDPQFTQFYANPLYLNPAFAGTARCPRLVMNYRNQWPALTGTFVTSSVSYDQHLDAISGGLGVLVWNDQAGEGTLNTNNVSAIYSYSKAVNRHFSIRAGFQASYFQKSLDWSKLTFGDMIDPRYGFIYNSQETHGSLSRSGVDFSAGILGFSKQFYGGFAVHHLAEPEEGILGPGARLPRKYTAHAGAIIPLNGRDTKEGSISPNLLFMKQQDFTQINMGLYVSRGPIVGGLWFRKDDAFIALIGLHAGKIKVGYTYDVTVSKLSNATAGSHEISMAIKFDCKPKRRKFRTISCPSF